MNPSLIGKKRVDNTAPVNNESPVYILDNGVYKPAYLLNGSYPITGPIRLTGDGLAWEDLLCAVISVKLPGISDPVYDSDNVGLLFSASQNNEIHITAQIKHRYKEGTSIYPHVHWEPKTNDSGNVRWTLDYKWTNLNAVESGSYTSIEKIHAAAGTALTHQLASFPAITGTGKTISSILSIKLKRTGGTGGDTYGYQALLKYFDIHYQADGFGSKSELAKDS